MREARKKVILAGNPNVGKSSLFNALTGMKQHTGNWPGKTVAVAKGIVKGSNEEIELIDVPGTYSLSCHSDEEEVARDAICFENADAIVVVCDATALERNLNLFLQINEFCHNTILCVNLMDEAKRKNISIDINKLSKILGVTVVTTIAKKKKTLNKLIEKIEESFYKKNLNKTIVKFDESIEETISYINNYINEKYKLKLHTRSVALKLLENDLDFIKAICKNTGIDFTKDKELSMLIKSEYEKLTDKNIDTSALSDMIIKERISECEQIAKLTVKYNDKSCNNRDEKIDKIVTGKKTGYLSMIIMLILIFWITITGANYPSEMLSVFFDKTETLLYDFICQTNCPKIIVESMICGVYRILGWIISVMLPPMAIFFPLFTYLEDCGLLPRIAYNLDGTFKKCSACGKQALTMCMGFGCNAVGVMGARIIDSKREKLLAILTNAFVPCNGRFPTIIMIITMFFMISNNSGINTLISSLILTVTILFSVFMTFIVTKVLSKTVLKGYPEAFTLELPPYRKPKLCEILIHSFTDRTFYILKRSLKVAAPSGLIIWIMANYNIGDVSILKYFADIINPFAKIMGLDGVLIMAFILGFPANEIVMPIALMGYMSLGEVNQINDLVFIKEILLLNGWTLNTAICVIVFSLMHWPCMTTILTIKKETNSLKWTIFSILIPTVCGILTCSVFTQIYQLILNLT